MIPVAEKGFSDLKTALSGLRNLMLESGDTIAAKELQEISGKLAQRELVLAFCGHFSAGKSSLINVLCDKKVMPSSPLPTSANAVMIRNGSPRARLTPIDQDKGMVEIGGSEVSEYCRSGAYSRVELWEEIDLLRAGGALLDTPGVDSNDEAHALATSSALHLADVVFYVMDYNHVSSETNLNFARTLSEYGKPLYLVVNQIDKHREEELAFSAFRKTAEAAFEAWNVNAAGVFYISLKKENLSANMLPSLKRTVSKLLQEERGLLQYAIHVSAYQSIQAHLERADEREREKREKLEEAAAGETDLARLEAELLTLTAGPTAEDPLEFKRQEWIKQIGSMLEHAQLMIPSLRELAGLYLESKAPGFKVKGLFASGKTEAEKSKRECDFLTALGEQAEAQLAWHVRSELRAAGQYLELWSPEWESRLDALLPRAEEAWISEPLPGGAVLSGESRLHYAAAVASGVTARYRKAALLVLDALLAASAPKRAALLAAAKERRAELEARLPTVRRLAELDAGAASRKARFDALLSAPTPLTSGQLPEVEQAAPQYLGAEPAPGAVPEAPGQAAAAQAGSVPASAPAGPALAEPPRAATGAPAKAAAAHAELQPTSVAASIPHPAAAVAPTGDGTKAHSPAFTSSAVAGLPAAGSPSAAAGEDQAAAGAPGHLAGAPTGDGTKALSPSYTSSVAAGFPIAAASENPAATPAETPALAAFARGRAQQAADKLDTAAELLASHPAFGTGVKELIRRAGELRRGKFTVALFGAFSAGKSSFAGALLGEAVLPVSPHPTTAAIVRILAPEPGQQHRTANVRFKSRKVMLEDLAFSFDALGLGAWKESSWQDTIQKLSASELPAAGRAHLSFLQAAAVGWAEYSALLGTERVVDANGFAQFAAEEVKACFVAEIDFYFSCPLTEMGIVLVDTPGADSIHARHTGVTFHYMKNSDAILFITYYNHAFSRADKLFLAQLGRIKGSFALDKMFFIVNASDLASSDDELSEVVEYVREGLQKAGIQQPNLFALSSLRELRHRQEGQSGFDRFRGEFASFLEQDLGHLAVSSAGNELGRITDRLRKWLNSARELAGHNGQRLEKLEEQRAAFSQAVRALREVEISTEWTQENDELMYYVVQRLRLQALDLFNDFFHPSLLQEAAGPLKRNFTIALRGWITQISLELERELYESSLRLERKAEHLLQREVASWCRQQQEGFEMPLESPSFTGEWISPGLPEGILDNTRFPEEEYWPYFRSPKAFFEGDGRSKLREALEFPLVQQLQSRVKDMSLFMRQHYELEIQGHKERIAAYFTDSWQEWEESIRRTNISDEELGLWADRLGKLEALLERFAGDITTQEVSFRS